MHKLPNNCILRLRGLFILFILFGCNTGALSPLEYAKWIENPQNGLISEKMINGISFSLQYKPIEYIIVNEHKNKKLKTKVLHASRKELDGLQYFTLRISMDGQHKSLTDMDINYPDADSEILTSYFSFEFQYDIKLIDGLDTMNCVLYHYEITSGLTPYNSASLAFISPDVNDAETNINQLHTDKVLLIKSKVLGIESAVLSINEESILNIPELKTFM